MVTPYNRTGGVTGPLIWRGNGMRRTALFACTGAVLILPSTGRASNSAKSLISLTSPSHMRLGVNAADTEPINGFISQVVIGLTDQENHSDSVEGFGVKSAAPGGSALPVGSPRYVVATLDSGSQADIISYDDYIAFNFAGANREGTKTQTVQGANGTEDLPITDAIGVYATDLANATVSAGAINVNTSTLRGQWNVPVLAGN